MQQNIYSILLFSLISLIFFYSFPVRFRNYILLFASLFFYGICDLKFLLLVMMETVFTWFIGKKSENKKWFLIGITFVLILLCIFKYFNFFIERFNLSFSKIILPLGISYYTFKIISYLVDIYLGKRKSEASIVNYSVYVLFFPHLLCGPIVRSDSMTNQMNAGIKLEKSKICDGLILIVSGLFMKIVIADRCTGYVNTVFSKPADNSSLALLIALFLYTIQLYCDFGGYSQIAIGLTELFGFDCINNFNRPYLSIDIRDFWRRWHISLSSWLRDYIYIPLGGNRCSRLRKWLNVFIVFLSCGIWHGSNLHFIVWGAYHGILNNLTPKKKYTSRFQKILMWILTMVLIMFGWLLFRVDTMKDAFQYVYLMLTNFRISYTEIASAVLIFTGDNTAIAYCLTLFFMIVLLLCKELFDEKYELQVRNKDCVILPKRKFIWTGIMLIFVILFGITGSSNFLYANF